MYLYKIINKINGRVYIGQTRQSVRRRWRAHCNCKVKSSAINLAIQKYGKESFEFRIVSRCSTQEEMDYREKYYIKLFNTLAPNGYNLKTGGHRCIEYTKELRKKLSESHKNYKITEETKRKISLATKGRKFTIEHCKNISEGKKGSKHPMYGKKGLLHYGSKSIICLNDGLIHESIGLASLYYKINHSKIVSVLKGKNSSISNLIFEYLNDSIANEIARKKRSLKLESLNKRKPKKVLCITTGQVFSSIAEASKILNINKGNISNAINGNRKSVGIYSFKTI